MKNNSHPIVVLILLILSNSSLAQPCNTADATACICADGTDNCELLPDIAISEDLFYIPSLNPETEGELAVSVSTPNIGFGPLRVIPTDSFICGIDTFYAPNGNFSCPNGEETRQLIKQRIYLKQGDVMSYYDRFAGSMTYHPTHNHMHVDDWGTYALRTEVPGTDPLTWPIVAQGSKLGFCLMDFGSCSNYYGYCRDDNQNILVDSNIPNFGLGGGNYSCGAVNQGISVGFTDIYYYNLDGMQIPIPQGVCNGNYMLVVQIDPNDNFLESNENNNVVVVPFTLSKQSETGAGAISVNGSSTICNGNSTVLQANFGNAFVWNNGNTNQTLNVSEAGQYFVDISTDCGVVRSDTIIINEENLIGPNIPTVEVCALGNNQIDLPTSNNSYLWYDNSNANNLIFQGNSNTVNLVNDTTFWIAQETNIIGESYFAEPEDNGFGVGGINGGSSNGELHFDALVPFELVSVLVFASGSFSREFLLIDDAGNILENATVFVQNGAQRVDLNFQVPSGVNFILKCESNPALYRNASNVNFPYTVPNVLSIHSTNFGQNFYYYFYNWEVKLADKVCITETSALQINYQPLTASINNLNSVISTSNPINLQASPSGGTFTGQGVFFNTLNPNLLNPGVYQVNYEATDGNGCTAIASQTFLKIQIDYNFIDQQINTIAP